MEIDTIDTDSGWACTREIMRISVGQAASFLYKILQLQFAATQMYELDLRPGTDHGKQLHSIKNLYLHSAQLLNLNLDHLP